MIRCGPAGWSYKDWEGIVYPSPKPAKFDPLEHISGYFDVVEVNSTFYGPQPASVARRWVARVSHNPRFRFTVKLWRRFTHQREAWTSAEVTDARATPETLASHDRLGAILVQFPWSFRREPDSREWLDDVVRTFEDLPLAIEVRHASWNAPEFFDELSDRDIAFVNIDQPLYADSLAPSARATAQVGYIRVHGRNYKDWWRHEKPSDRYDYLYTADELRPWADRAREVAGQARETYVITNNHYKGKAAANALMLDSMINERSPAAPPELMNEYGELLSGFVSTG